MSTVQTKSRPKSKKAPPAHHRGEGAASIQVNDISSAPLGGLYSAVPAFTLGLPGQAKLEIGSADDPFEKEADAVAESVTAGLSAPPISTIPATGLTGSPPQRSVDEKETAESSPMLQQVEEQIPDEEVPQLMLLQQASKESVSKDEEEPQNMPAQPMLVQRQPEDKALEESGESSLKEPQPMLLQRATEESIDEIAEEPKDMPAQPKLIQRQPESEADVEPSLEEGQPLLIQRQKVEDNEKEPDEPEGLENSLPMPLMIQRQQMAEGEEPELAPSKPTVQAQLVGNQGFGGESATQTTATAAVQNKGVGTPINLPTRRTLESRMGIDFSDVQVHQDSTAQAATADIKARAFTHQNHIWLGHGESQSDLELMAHEATHVVQQSGNGIQRKSVPDIQREEETSSTSQADDPAAQEFSMPTDEVESRLESTPTEGAVTPASDVKLAPQTESNLDEVEEGGEEEQAPEEAEEQTEEEAPTEEETGNEEEAALAAEATDMVEPTGFAPPTPGPSAEFESLVDEQVTQYLDNNLSPERLAQLDPTTQALLQGASALSQQQVVEPETGSFLGNLTGLTPLAQAFTRQAPRGYEQEEPWLQVVARVRDITSALGGVVGIIGLVATVSGLILSLLIPPVGAFLLTAGRFCDIAALILDTITLVLSGILTGYNLYRLKNATDPEEKRRLLGLVRQEAMQTVMSGVAVATAITPGIAKGIGNTRVGRAATNYMGDVTSKAGQRIASLGRKIAGSRAGRAIAGSFVGRGAAAFGRSAATVGRGFTSVGRGVVGLGKSGLVRLRGTSPIRWANRVTGQMEERARNYFRSLATRNTRLGRFYNRRIRGFHERNVQVAQMINDPIEQAYHLRLGGEITDYVDDLQRQGITSANQINIRVRQQFGDRAGDFRAVRQRGNLKFRDDSDVLQQVRENEFTEIQLIRERFPEERIRTRIEERLRKANPDLPADELAENANREVISELTEHINRSPFIKGKWTQPEMGRFLDMHPNVRQGSGQLVSGVVPKTPHHTIPAQMAPQIHRTPRFMQIVNDPRSYYNNFLRHAYPPSEFRGLPRPSSVRVPTGSGTTRQARNIRETLQGMVDRGDFTVPNRNFFESEQFVRELREQGSTGAWINPRNPNESFLFNPHFVIGHNYNWQEEVARQIFDQNTRLGLRGEPIRQMLVPSVRQLIRENRESRSGSDVAPTNGSGSERSLTEGSSHLIDSALAATARMGLRATGREMQETPMPAGKTGIDDSFSTMMLPPTLALAGLAQETDHQEVAPDGDEATTVPSAVGNSQVFLASLNRRMAQPVVTFAGMSTFPSAKSAQAGETVLAPRMSMQRQPEPPPSPVPYSPASLASIREMRLSVVSAIDAVQTYIAATQQTERDNELARRASEILLTRNEEQQTAIECEQQDISDQQGNLDQSEGAQQEMASETDRASSESDRGKSQSESVQSEGGDVRVEAKPEEPRKKSWLERAWDATAGAVWRRLVRPVIRAARRKVNQVMQKINDFIMRMINQALGLDEIEAELAGGGEDIQQRRTSLQETDANLGESMTATIEDQQKNEETVEQANTNINQARVVRSNAEQLLTALLAHHNALQQEEEIASAYVSSFGFKYQEFFEDQENQSESSEVAESRSDSTPAEESVTQAHVMPVVAHIDALEGAEQYASQEVATAADKSGASISPDMWAAERETATIALTQFGSTQSARVARLAALRGEALACVGIPTNRGLMILEQIVDEIVTLAEVLERERLAAMQMLSDIHLEANAGGGVDESE